MSSPLIIDIAHPLPTWHLGASQTVRHNKIIHSITAFFQDLIYKSDPRESFQSFYDSLQPRFQIIHNNLAQGQGDFEEIKRLLKIVANIETSAWGYDLGYKIGKADQSSADPLFLKFRGQVNAIQALAQRHLQRLDRSHPETHQLARWIESNEEQQRYAVYIGHQDVPYLYSEIPAGSILLDNPSSTLYSHVVRGNYYSYLYTIIKLVKRILAWLFTGMTYTHAELALSNGQVFDLLKDRDHFLAGKGLIKDMGSRVCYRDVLTPNQAKILAAYNEKNPPVATYQEAFSILENEVKSNIDKITASPWDIAKTCLPFRRHKDYDLASEWNPGVVRLGCSPYVSALFGRFGIDVGAKHNKLHQSITPANLAQSDFHEPLYVTT